MRADVLIPEARELASGANFCVLSVLSGAEVRSYVMWVGVVGERLVVVSPSGSPKTEAILASGRVTLLIWLDGHAYDYVELRCRVSASETGGVARRMLEQTLAVKYRGRAYPRPDVTEWTMIELAPLTQRSW
ncbi:MAG: class probable F420-dependent enzyme [Actinomycetia bacterium]|nr:class probable F420-dependent enzyme [Actinomycetes bacterium]